MTDTLRSALEPAARWHDEKSKEAMDSLHCGDNLSTISATKRLARWHNEAAAAIRALPLDLPSREEVQKCAELIRARDHVDPRYNALSLDEATDSILSLLKGSGTSSDGGGEVADPQKQQIGPVEFRGQKSLEALAGSCASTADATALRSSAGVAPGPSETSPPLPPPGYGILPGRLRCRCIKLWEDGKGNFYCCKRGEPASPPQSGAVPTEAMILAGGEVLLDACSSEKGMLKPWKPFDTAQVAIKVWNAMLAASPASPASPNGGETARVGTVAEEAAARGHGPCSGEVNL